MNYLELMKGCLKREIQMNEALIQLLRDLMEEYFKDSGGVVHFNGLLENWECYGHLSIDTLKRGFEHTKAYNEKRKQEQK